MTALLLREYNLFWNPR